LVKIQIATNYEVSGRPDLTHIHW